MTGMCPDYAPVEVDEVAARIVAQHQRGRCHQCPTDGGGCPQLGWAQAWHAERGRRRPVGETR